MVFFFGGSEHVKLTLAGRTIDFCGKRDGPNLGTSKNIFSPGPFIQDDQLSDDGPELIVGWVDAANCSPAHFAALRFIR